MLNRVELLPDTSTNGTLIITNPDARRSVVVELTIGSAQAYISHNPTFASGGYSFPAFSPGPDVTKVSLAGGESLYGRSTSPSGTATVQAHIVEQQ